ATQTTGASEPGRHGLPHPEQGRPESDGPERRAARNADTIPLVDIARIMHAIPHRYPFLLIDRVVDVVRNVSAIGVKNVSVDESFFQGHFPHHPVMPGV